MTKGNTNAFTTPLPENLRYSDDSNYDGLTKREYFAAMAMQGLCKDGAWSQKVQQQCESKGVTSSQGIAYYAVDLADALIEALNKTK